MIARYTRPAMLALWSDDRRFDTWLSVELAACRAMEKEQLVPAGTADRVEAKARGKLVAARILEIEEKTRHDVIAFLTHVEEIAGADARWLHLGLTSSDVLDTATALLLKTATEQILVGVGELAAALAKKAAAHRSTPMIGRSHGIHAEPITLGVAFAGFHAETMRNEKRLRDALANISYGKLAGAVGTYTNLPPSIETAALTSLGLQPETIATQVVPRDRHAELLSALALLGAGIERIAIQVRHWQRTEVGEAEEAFGKGQKGSSAMPHKKNPILSENLTGLARLLRAYAGAALEDIGLWHERDISHSSVERMILPDATATADFMLARATSLVDGLVIHEKRLTQNLNQTGGLIFSESVMLRLIKTGLPRQTAYEIVQRSALKARDEGGDFQSLLLADPDISSRLKPDEVKQAFDLQHHIRHTGLMVDRALKERPRS